jgi:predicted TIM-barrel fold metal-dependent hydrolase
MNMAIDMHAHWRPAELIDALRLRTAEPRVFTNDDGVEVYKARNGEVPVSEAFDNIETRLEEMERQGISTAVLSLLSEFTWIERLPLEESLPLVKLYNNSLSALCAAHEGQFTALCALPLADIKAAAAEFDRAMTLPGMVGAQAPGNAFLTYKEADAFRPVIEVAHRNKAAVLIHFAPMPGDTWPRVPKGTDNARRRMGTLDMQASLSANMVTLSMTDIMDDYPDAMMILHNLGGNIPFEVERMDHRCLLDTPDEELPSQRFREANVFVDCNSLGAHAIEAGVRLYGEDRIVFGTDGTEFGGKWTNNALAEAGISDHAKDQIRHGNAVRMLSHLAPLATYSQAAE